MSNGPLLYLLNIFCLRYISATIDCIMIKLNRINKYQGLKPSCVYCWHIMIGSILDELWTFVVLSKYIFRGSSRLILVGF